MIFLSQMSNALVFNGIHGRFSEFQTREYWKNYQSPLLAGISATDCRHIKHPSTILTSIPVKDIFYLKSLKIQIVFCAIADLEKSWIGIIDVECEYFGKGE